MNRLILAALLCAAFPAAARAASAVKVTATQLNVRDAAMGNVLGTVPSGSSFALTGKESQGFVEIWYRGTTGWISKSFAVAHAGRGVAVGIDDLNVRDGASMNGSIVGKVHTGQVYVETGESGDWVQITFDGTNRWVSRHYVTSVALGNGNAATPSPTPTPPTPAPPATGANKIADPTVRGPFATQRVDLTVDAGSISLHLPNAAGPRPLVVFNHGWAMSTGSYERIGEHLASHGFACALFQQPNRLSTSTGSWAGKLRKAIDGLAQSSVRAKLDLSRIAFMGHSYGGAAATWGGCEDPRVKAVVALCPVNQWHWSGVKSSAKQMRVPMLIVAAQGDLLARVNGYTRPLYELIASRPRQYVELASSGHGVVMDGAAGSAQHARALGYATAWLQRFLNGAADPDGWTDGRRARVDSLLSEARASAN